MLMMARREILPAVLRYTGDMAEAGNRVARFSAGLPNAAASLVSRLCDGSSQLEKRIADLSDAMQAQPIGDDPLASARYMKDVVIPAMRELRKVSDELETITDRKAWPFPTYDELLFNM